MKIAIFQKDLSVGGIQKSLVNTLNILKDKYEIDLYLYSKNNDFYLDKIPSNVNIIYIKSNKLNQFLPFSLFNSLNKKKYLNKNYDISIDYNGYQNDTACGALNVNSKKKIIWIHSDLEKRYQYDKKYRHLFKLSKKKYNYFDSFVFVSDGVKTAFLKMLEINNKEMTIIGNQIDDLKIQEKAKEECDLVVDNSKYNIVTTGRLVYVKGFDILLNDIKRLTQYRKDFHLYFLGDGIMREKLNDITNDLNLNDYVTFLGNQTNPYKFMTKMDGFALTSRYEGQGIVILEAKTLGLELFISKNLEKYGNGEFTGYENITLELAKAKKKNKKMVSLKEYNQKNENELLNILKY